MASPKGGRGNLQGAFAALEGQVPRPGARSKVFSDGPKQLRWLEFTADRVEPGWCENGHVGIVRQGELDMDFHGRLVRCEEGAALFMPAGPAQRREARALTPTVRLSLVEDV